MTKIKVVLDTNVYLSGIIFGGNSRHILDLIIQKKIYCVPCAHMFDVPRFCKEGHLRCLREITPQDVFDATVSLINENIINL